MSFILDIIFSLGQWYNYFQALSQSDIQSSLQSRSDTPREMTNITLALPYTWGT